MKNLITLFTLMFISFSVFAQNNITNTIGIGGAFTVKDASGNFLQVSQSTGNVSILKSIDLENTGNSSTIGVIFKGVSHFLHNFQPSGSSTNTFLGINSGNFTMSSANGFNTGLGTNTLNSLTTGYSNTALGSFSLNSTTTGIENTASGYMSLFNNTTGIGNSAYGSNSLISNIGGIHNNAFGNNALYHNTTGSENSAFGYRSQFSNTTGHDNLSFGSNTLENNEGGFANIAIGSGAMYLNVSGVHNIAIGYQSSLNNTGNWNTSVGSYSLLSNTSGFSNSALGYNSLHNNTTGEGNVAIGRGSLESNTTGYSNTAVGYNAGNSITTGSFLTCVGYGAQPSAADATNEITFGDNFITSIRANVTSITSLSDARDKKNIKDLDLGIDFLMKLKPRKFNWDKREWYENNISDGSKAKAELTAGFIAQELDEAQTEENAEWLKLVLKTNPEKIEATYGNLLPIIVKAIQDLKNENDELKLKNNEFQVANNELISRLSKFEQLQAALVSEIEKLKTNSNEFTKVSLGAK